MSDARTVLGHAISHAMSLRISTVPLVSVIVSKLRPMQARDSEHIKHVGGCLGAM